MTGRRDLLLQAKITGHVRSQRGDEVIDRITEAGTDTAFPAGAALSDPTTATAWVLAEDDPARSLGGALVWADRRQATQLHLLVGAAAPMLARRAQHLDRTIDVWAIDGTELVRAMPAPLHDDHAKDDTGPLPPDLEPFAALFERAGADTVHEHGILRAEVLGLEVARIVDGRLNVGVGKHDREAQKEVLGDRQQGLDELFEVVRIVAEHRVADGAGHAAYHLSPERWLRSTILRRPELVGAAEGLRPVAPATPRDDLRQPSPAPAAGTDRTTGEPLLVVCSVGTDLDVVPSSIDTYLADGRDPRVRFVLPEGDALRATQDLVAALRPKAELVTVSREWRRL
jgi:hypothetical protein